MLIPPTTTRAANTRDTRSGGLSNGPIGLPFNTVIHLFIGGGVNSEVQHIHTDVDVPSPYVGHMGCYHYHMALELREHLLSVLLLDAMHA